MTSRAARIGLLLGLSTLLLLPAGGCWFFKSETDAESKFVLGDLVEDFDPPTLEELEESVEWEPQPVLDGLQLMRERMAEQKPLVTVEQALELENTSEEANEQILSALGQMPENDEAVDWDATFSRHHRADVSSTNPLLTSSAVESDVFGLISFGLFGFDWNFRPFASKDAVVSWHTSKDGMYDKVVMRDDMTWSDGKPITAYDVEFSFQAIMSSGVPASAIRSGTDKLKWVKAYDDHTLVYFHKEPLVTNIWNLNFYVIPKHIYEKSIAEDPTLTNSDTHVKYERNPISGGPYDLVDRTIGKELVLRRRDSFYMHNGKQVRDKPYFKEIRFNIIEDDSAALLALKAGDIEEKELRAEEWETKTNGSDFYKNNTKVYELEWTSFHFLWNTEEPWFADKRVRQAMSYAFDHDEMLNTLLFGLYEPCAGMFHPTSPWAAQGLEPYKRDVAKAEELLEAAGWIDHDGDGIRDKEINGKLERFEFSIITANFADRIDVCNLLSQNLRAIGIICNVRPLEFTIVIEQMLNNQFHAAYGGWGTGAHPDTSSNIFATTGERNYGKYSNKRVDALFEAGREEFDLEERAKIYQEIHRLTYEDQPYTWLYYRNAFYGFNKDLRGYVFSPRGPYTYSPGSSNIWKPAQ